LAVSGRSKRSFLGRGKLEKSSRLRGERCGGGAGGCRREGETDGTGPPRRWEKMAPRIHMEEFVWRRLMLPPLL